MRSSRRAVLAFAAGSVTAGCLRAPVRGAPGTLTEEWISERSTSYQGNHHRIGVACIEGESIIGIPHNDGSDGCGVVALDTEGEERWHEPLDGDRCGHHAIGDAGVGRFTRITEEFLIPFSDGDVVAYDPLEGTETFRAPLIESIGYAAPITADLDGSGDMSLIVADFNGRLTVTGPDGSRHWEHRLGDSIFASPIIGDWGEAEEPSLAVAHGSRPSEVVCFDRDGERLWHVAGDGPAYSFTLLADGETIVRTDRREVHAQGAADGESQWTATVGRDVRIGETDHDHVYTAAEGMIRALDVTDGSIAWTARLGDASIGVAPPTLAAVREPDQHDVVVCTDAGEVFVLDRDDGAVLAEATVEGPCYVPPVAVDLFGSGIASVVMLLGDGRVQAMSVES